MTRYIIAAILAVTAAAVTCRAPELPKEHCKAIVYPTGGKRVCSAFTTYVSCWVPRECIN